MCYHIFMKKGFIVFAFIVFFLYVCSFFWLVAKYNLPATLKDQVMSVSNGNISYLPTLFRARNKYDKKKSDCEGRDMKNVFFTIHTFHPIYVSKTIDPSSSLTFLKTGFGEDDVQFYEAALTVPACWTWNSNEVAEAIKKSGAPTFILYNIR
jgi:hypothetical protein